MHRVLQTGRDCPYQLYSPVIFQIWNWGTGKWRDLSRASDQLVLAFWSRETDSPFSNFQGSFFTSLLICFCSSPFQLAPDLDLVAILASVLPSGCTDGTILVFSKLLGLRLSCPEVLVPGDLVRDTLSTCWPLLPLLLLLCTTQLIQVLLSARHCAWQFTKQVHGLHTTTL